MNPRIVIALVVVAMAAFVAVALAAGSASDEDTVESGERFEGATLPEGLRAPELGLRDEEGEVVRMAELRGQPVIVTFLYSSCDDSCPAQAQQVKGALNELGEDLPALAISVDPVNDTAQSARAFLSEQRMTGRMRFLLGRRPELRRVWRGYGIQPQLDDLDHTARIVLVDGHGVQRVGYPLGEVTPERLAHDLRLLAAGR
ncbi:MAG TPA: SCO family protein [Thermoleophilaceae bacterium]|nr:SCO family protein [Thermoleophilaceae bacterium]